MRTRCNVFFNTVLVLFSVLSKTRTSGKQLFSEPFDSAQSVVDRRSPGTEISLLRLFCSYSFVMPRRYLRSPYDLVTSRVRPTDDKGSTESGHVGGTRLPKYERVDFFIFFFFFRTFDRIDSFILTRRGVRRHGFYSTTALHSTCTSRVFFVLRRDDDGRCGLSTPGRRGSRSSFPSGRTHAGSRSRRASLSQTGNGQVRFTRRSRLLRPPDDEQTTLGRDGPRSDRQVLYGGAVRSRI